MDVTRIYSRQTCVCLCLTTDVLRGTQKSDFTDLAEDVRPCLHVNVKFVTNLVS